MAQQISGTFPFIKCQSIHTDVIHVFHVILTLEA